jgi:dolichyl-phosphate-mannose--protein O-mannosyl transferase
MYNRFEKALPVLFFLLALLLRVWGIADNAGLRGDEGFQVPSALNYIQTGHSEPDNWIHPPLKNILLAVNVKIWGNNPYGWRMLNVILGSLTVMGLYLFAKELFSNIVIASIAALFLAFDPLHIFYSRSNFQEIPAACFFLLSVLLQLRYLDGSRWSAIAAGTLLGLAHAMKWYYIVAWIVMLCYVAYRKSRQPEWSRVSALFLESVFVALPIAVYLLTYYAWFSRGYSLFEFGQMQVDMFREMTSMAITGFKQQLAEIGSSYYWFIKPMFYAFPLGGEGPWRKVLVMMNNPPVWLLVLPSSAYLLFLQRHRMDRKLILLIAIFAAVYVQFLLTSRPVFLYSALAVLPFALLLVAVAVVRVSEMFKRPESLVRSIMLGFLIWSMMVYPLATGRSTPIGLSGLFLSR